MSCTETWQSDITLGEARVAALQGECEEARGRVKALERAAALEAAEAEHGRGLRDELAELQQDMAEYKREATDTSLQEQEHQELQGLQEQALAEMAAELVRCTLRLPLYRTLACLIYLSLCGPSPFRRRASGNSRR